MAAQACIAVAQLQRLRGVGHTEAVIVAQIVAHEVAAGHVATAALRARRAWRVAVMGGRVVVLGDQFRPDIFAPRRCAGVMALRADGIAAEAKLAGMRIVAVRAAHAGRVHAALGEGAVLEDFLVNLAVDFVQASAQGRGQVVVIQRTLGAIAVAQRRTPAVTACAGLDFAAVAAIAEVDHQAAVAQIEAFGLSGPGQVIGGRAVTTLATHPQRLPVAGKLPGLAIEATLEAGGMAFDTHEVGVLLRATPVQRIAIVDPLRGVEVEPGLLLDIPGGAQGLQAPAR
ncbi:hypothetical protein D3C85_1000930 [compost metagenome]